MALNVRCEQREIIHHKIERRFLNIFLELIETKPVSRNVKKSLTCVLVKRGCLIWLYCIFSLFFFSDWTRRKKIMDYHCPFHLYALLSGELHLKTKLYTFSVYFNSVSLLTFVNIFWQIPLFGIKSSESVDHFFHMRVIWASHRGVVLIFDQNVH